MSILCSRAAEISLPSSMPGHPRLLASEGQFAELRGQIKTDPVSARIYADLLRRADGMLAQPPVTYQKEGRRLLAVSREALARISTLAMVYRLTDDPRYADHAMAELRAVAAFKDWNPSHYLDTAEMTLAVAIGYDWLYDRLGPDDREACARVIVDLGLRQSEAPSPQTWWITGENNWNQVCHAGMVAGAIAVADRQPELAARVINRAVANLHLAADGYAPDGAYPEGPMYWGYGTSFHVILADELTRFLGQAHGTDGYPGFLASADYIMQMVLPDGRFFDYSDCDTRPVGLNVPQYWFSRRTGRADLLFCNDAYLAAIPPGQRLAVEPVRLLALALLWRDPALGSGATTTPPPLSWFGRGPNPVAVHRSAWGDPRASFVGLKGGVASVSHGHMDVGSFVLGADGVRWAVDPGMQEYYSLEKIGYDLWTGGQKGPRWKVFRLGPESHNILRFDGEMPRVDGRGELVRFSASPASSVLDLTGVYQDRVESVFRGVMLLPDRRVLIQDEWCTGNHPAVATWQMLTTADSVTADEDGIRLHQAGESLALVILSPAGVKITIEDVSAPRADYDAPNPGLKRITLTAHTPAKAKGGFRILAVPGSVKVSSGPPYSPLESWGDPVARQ